MWNISAYFKIKILLQNIKHIIGTNVGKIYIYKVTKKLHLLLITIYNNIQNKQWIG